jgi:hypothetical protein
MEPPLTIIIAHETPNRRSTWAPHGQYGWYLGPDLEHYRCYTAYITKTRGSTIVEKVDFPPEKFTLPFPTPQDLATKAAADWNASPQFSKAPHEVKQKLMCPPPKKGTTMHLRGCVLMFHLQGCQAQQHVICLLITTNPQIQFRIHIDG